MNQINTAAPQKAKAPQSKATVLGELCFIVPQREKPSFNSSRITSGVPEAFFGTKQRPMPIYNMREISDDLDIDHQGFELMHHTTHVENLYNDDAVESEYNPRSMACCASASAPERSSYST